tara:strand:+ start:339 stop:575 length:237 start_codon:yes stop_codon:yes gene_type:complete
MSQQDKDFIDSLFRAQRKYLKESEAEGKSFFFKKEINATGGRGSNPSRYGIGAYFSREFIGIELAIGTRLYRGGCSRV